jgi:hypothetical protein
VAGVETESKAVVLYHVPRYPATVPRQDTKVQLRYDDRERGLFLHWRPGNNDKVGHTDKLSRSFVSV